MAIQPKNTTAILVDSIAEKTAATGVTLSTAIKFVTTGMLPTSVTTPTIDIGATTSQATHFRNIYAIGLKSSGGDLTIGTRSAHVLSFITSDVSRVSITGADVIQDPTNGGNLYWNKTSTAIALSIASSITAAGTIITDATDLTSIFNKVTTTPASTGVQLFDAPTGAEIEVWNAGANALLVYPHSAAGTMNGGSAGVAVSIAANTLGKFKRFAGNDWLAMEHTIAAA